MDNTNNNNENFEYNITDLITQNEESDGNLHNYILTNENYSNGSGMNSTSNKEMGIHYINIDSRTESIQPSTSNSQPSSIEGHDECCVFNLVKDWNLQIIYPSLKENDIDIAALKYMRKHHIERVLNNYSIGIAIKFEKYLMEWQKQQDTYNEMDLATIKGDTMTIGAVSSSVTSISPNRKLSKNITLEEILDQSMEGKNLIKISKEQTILSDTSRSILINLIVNFYIQRNLHMGVKECDSMSRQITMLFPDETKGVYFQRRLKQKPKGQLYDRYNNYTAKLRQNDFLPKAKRFKAVETCVVDESTPEPDAKDICKFLKYNRDDSNEKLIMEKWEASVIFRKATIRNNSAPTIKQILEEWPAYTQTYGPNLIYIDFNYLYPEASNFFVQVDQFVNDILYILNEKLSDPPSKKLLKEFQQQKNPTIDSKNFITFHLLHGLLRPTTKKCRTVNNKKIWLKYTISDSQNSFMIFSKSFEECEHIIQTKKFTATTEKHTIQPFVFIIGANEFLPAYFYVYMDGIKYKFPSVVAAIDCALKLFHVFNIKYPEESVAVWFLLQKYLYNIQTDYDPVFPTVDLLISKLRMK